MFAWTLQNAKEIKGTNTQDCLLQAGVAGRANTRAASASASQRQSEAPKQPEQLGTTPLGRQRLQKKADSFADMVQLVAVADDEDAVSTERPKVQAADCCHRIAPSQMHGRVVPPVAAPTFPNSFSSLTATSVCA